MDIYGGRPVLQSIIQPAALMEIETPATDLEDMRPLLNRVVGSNQLLPPPSRIPEQLREPLTGLADNLSKAETVAMAAKKLNPDDTQTLVDVLDIVSLLVVLITKDVLNSVNSGPRREPLLCPNR
jgi:hypothetical protein